MRRDCNHIPCKLPNCDCKIEPEGLEYVDKVDIPELGNLSKARIKEIQEMAAKGEKTSIVEVALPKESLLERIFGTKKFKNTKVGGLIIKAFTSKKIGAIKDVLGALIPAVGAFDRVTDVISKLIFQPNQYKVMEQSKPWYKSVTVNSIIVIIALVANQFLDIQIAEADLQNTIEAVGLAVASVVALYGRIRAEAQIGSK